MTNTWTGDATQSTRSDSWFSTTSPDVAIHLARLPSTRIGSACWAIRTASASPGVTGVGPITVGDITYDTDVALNFDQTRPSYHVHVPIEGWLESRHRGQQLTSTPALAAIYRPDAEIAATRWPGGSRHLAVKIDQVAVDRALETLVNGPAGFAHRLQCRLAAESGCCPRLGAAALMVHRQLECPDSLV